MIFKFTQTTPINSITTTIKDANGNNVQKTSYVRNGEGNKCACLLNIDDQSPFIRCACWENWQYRDGIMIGESPGDLLERVDAPIDLIDTKPLAAFADWVESSLNHPYGYYQLILNGVVSKDSWDVMFTSQRQGSVNSESSLVFLGNKNDGSLQRSMLKQSNSDTIYYQYNDSPLNKWEFEDSPSGYPPNIYKQNVIKDNGDLFIIEYNTVPIIKAVTDEIKALKNTVNYQEIFDNYCYVSWTLQGSWGSNAYYPIPWSPLENGGRLSETFIEDRNEILGVVSYAQPISWFELEYDRWILKCLKAGKIIMDNAEDITDYYVKMPSKGQVEFTWKNDWIDLGNSDVFEQIKIGGKVFKRNDFLFKTDILIRDGFANVVAAGQLITREWSVSPILITIDDILKLDNPASIDGFLVLYIWGVSGDTDRNWCYAAIDLKNRVVSEIRSDTDINYNNPYHDRINRGTAPTPIEPDPDEPAPDTPSDPPIAPSNPTLSSALLTCTYAISGDGCRQFGNFLWNGSLLDNLKLINNNPVGNVVSVKIFPLNMQSNNEKTITLGNVSTGVKGDVILTSKKVVLSGSLTIERLYNNFNDFEPYTTMELFVPFYGYRPIPCEMAYGTLELRWIFDYITGLMLCEIMKDGYVAMTISANCGVEIPIAYSNRVEIEKSFITGITSVSGIMGALLEDRQTSSIGSPSPDCGLYTPYTPFVKITTNNPIYPSNYGHSIGYACEKGGYLREFSGFTVVSDIELTCPCTAEERERILALLKSGVYL